MLDLKSIFGGVGDPPPPTGPTSEGPANDTAAVERTAPSIPRPGLLDSSAPTKQDVLPGFEDDGADSSDFDFSGWTRRPDAKGRMGWESPGLPEGQRWWARCDFEDLPEPAANVK